MCDEGGGVVTREFGGTSATRAGADVVFGKPDGDGVDAAFEVGTCGRSDEHEGVGVGGPDAEVGFGGDHEGAQVERFFSTGCGHPVLVDVHKHTE